MDAAVAHINTYSSNHTDCILTENDKTADKFFERIDSAILMRNASTQFADGGEFGMGAEIGIATGKMHARARRGRAAGQASNTSLSATARRGPEGLPSRNLAAT